MKKIINWYLDKRYTKELDAVFDFYYHYGSASIDNAIEVISLNDGFDRTRALKALYLASKLEVIRFDEERIEI